MSAGVQIIVKYGTAVLIVSIAAAAFYVGCVRRFVSNLRLRTIVSHTTRIFALPASSDRIEAARELARSARAEITQSPSDVDLWMAIGANLRILGRYPDAVTAYQNALSWGERPEIYLNLAAAESLAGDSATAVDHLVRAAEFDATTIASIDDGYVRDLALKRLLARVSRDEKVRIYVTLAMEYLRNGYYNEAAGMIANATLIDRRAISLPVLRGWGGNDVVLRYALDELARRNKAAKGPQQ